LPELSKITLPRGSVPLLLVVKGCSIVGMLVPLMESANTSPLFDGLPPRTVVP